MTALAAAYRWLIETIRRGFDWLRKPGNTVKAALAAILLALIYWGATATLRSYAQGQRITVLITERDNALADRERVQGRLETERAEWAQFRDDWAARQRERMAELEAAKAESAEAMAERDAAIKRAAASAHGWRVEYGKRGPECRAALETLDIACASLGDY